MISYAERWQDIGQEVSAFVDSNEPTAVYSAMCEKAVADGALSTKMKELIGVAIAVARECETCILAHVDQCVKLGATRQELIEALNVTLIFCGGPGLAYSAKALKAYDEFTAKK